MAVLLLRANERRTKVDYHLSDGRDSKTGILGGYRRHKLADTEKGFFQAYVTLSGMSLLVFPRREICTPGLSKVFWTKGM